MKSKSNKCISIILLITVLCMFSACGKVSPNSSQSAVENGGDTITEKVTLTDDPTVEPTESVDPTKEPTTEVTDPVKEPTTEVTNPEVNKTPETTKAPTAVPTKEPTTEVTDPVKEPTTEVTNPEVNKTPETTKAPTAVPTKEATKAPTVVPTKAPTVTKAPVATNTPTKEPTKAPVATATPTKAPIAVPTKAPTHTHNYTSKVTKQATCTSEGVETFTCSCGDSYTKNIAKISHFDENGIPNKSIMTSSMMMAHHTNERVSCTGEHCVCGYILGARANHYVDKNGNSTLIIPWDGEAYTAHMDECGDISRGAVETVASWDSYDLVYHCNTCNKYFVWNGLLEDYIEVTVK